MYFYLNLRLCYSIFIPFIYRFQPLLTVAHPTVRDEQFDSEKQRRADRVKKKQQSQQLRDGKFATSLCVFLEL